MFSPLCSKINIDIYSSHCLRSNSMVTDSVTILSTAESNLHQSRYKSMVKSDQILKCRSDNPYNHLQPIIRYPNLIFMILFLKLIVKLYKPAILETIGPTLPVNWDAVALIHWHIHAGKFKKLSSRMCPQSLIKGSRKRLTLLSSIYIQSWLRMCCLSPD